MELVDYKCEIWRKGVIGMRVEQIFMFLRCKLLFGREYVLDPSQIIENI